MADSSAGSYFLECLEADPASNPWTVSAFFATLQRMKRVKVLAIETSCDETAVSLVSVTDKSARVLKSLVTSQIPIHQKYGGVVPEVAARSHVPETVSLITQALSGSTATTKVALGKKGSKAFDVVAVTRGPGLPTALSVGVEAGRVLAFLSGKPLIGVNHLEGHVASAWLDPANRRKWRFPLLALVVSGGHTELVLMRDFCAYEIIGQTRDDAAGEAFDKTAKLMGLPYPGGPQIAKLALEGNPSAYAFPRPMLNDDTLDFSFSGLKTAVRTEWGKGGHIPADFAASLQQATVDVLVEKTMRAAHRHAVKGILLVGGVSANAELRRQLGERIKKDLKRVAFLPSDKTYITDNAAMIGVAGAWQFFHGHVADWKTLDIKPDMILGAQD
ncbi:MAG: tRNA (adenosine(37)-N6)-threonylcarbamoyltransferase complex transferase subunit TsaD [Patescibacteria group bacterium]